MSDEEIRSTLVQRREGIEAKIATMTKAPEKNSGISFGKRVGDGTIEAVSRLSEVGVVDSLQASLEKIARAMEKLDEGSYGCCDVCGTKIAPKRMEAIPESIVCVDHAR